MTTYEPGTNGEQAAADFLADVQLRLLTLMDEKGVSRAELARRLKTVRSSVTRLLGADSNMTVMTLGRIFEALDEVPEVTSPTIRKVLERVRSSDEASPEAGGMREELDTSLWEKVIDLESYRRDRKRGAAVRFVRTGATVGQSPDELVGMVA